MKDNANKSDIRCPNGHKVAEADGEGIYIKCKSCRHIVHILSGKLRGGVIEKVFKNHL